MPFSSMLVAIDGSLSDQKAFDTALEPAKAIGAVWALIVVFVALKTCFSRPTTKSKAEDAA